MSNLGSKDALSPPESSWAVGGSLILFILSALLLLGVQGITLYDRFARASEVGLDNHVWIFSQLEVEAKNFNIALLEAMTAEGADQPDAAHERKVRLAFDIYYSRTRTATSVAREAFEDARVRSRFELLVQSSQKLANQMDAKSRLTAQDIVAFYNAFNADVPFIRKVANAAMLDSISNAEERREARHWILGQLQLVMGLVIVLMVLSVRQAMKVTRSVSHHAAETAKVVSRLSRTLNASLDAVVIVNDEGKIKEYNAALRNILKMQSADAITDLDVMEIIAKEDRKEIGQLMALLRLDGPAGPSDIGAAQRINLHIYDATGALVPVELSCAIDHSFDGRFSYIVFIRDRSQEVAAANVLRDARDRARMDAKAKERFLSVLSHEMRTPLHGVITSLELVQLGEVKASEQGFLQTASACAKSALTQIDDVLALTRNGYLGDTDEPFLPSKLIDDIVSEIVPLALERGNTISVVVQGDAKQSLIKSKSRSFQLTVRNLVSNAVKYTSNGEIEVTVTAQTVAAGLISVEVAIKDTGIGIRPVDQSRIFEEFAMVGDSAAGKASGFGLGLSIAKSSVERLRGRIGVESELGKGSRFFFSFEAPATDQPAPAPKLDVLILSAVTKATTPLNILIVDDNPVNRALMSEMVRRLGHHPEMALDGTIALSMSREKLYDIILMDLSMPGLSGFEAARLIRRESINGDSRIYALTARDLTECRDEVRQAGMEGAYQKPISMVQLRDLIDQAAPAKPDAAPPPAFPVLENFRDVLGLMGRDMTRKLAAAMMEDTAEAQRAQGRIGVSVKAKIELAHRAGGSAAVLGATRLAEGWRSVETALRAEDKPGYERLMSVIPKYIEQTRAALSDENVLGPEVSIE